MTCFTTLKWQIAGGRYVQKNPLRGCNNNSSNGCKYTHSRAQTFGKSLESDAMYGRIFHALSLFHFILKVNRKL